MGAAVATSRFVIGIGLALSLLASAPVLGSEEFFGIRNYSPFAQVFGLPGFADASVLDARQTTLALNTTVISHADLGSMPGEGVVLDGETYITNLGFDTGISERLTLGVEVPWVAYNGGIFDSAIASWHDFWGFPNGSRDGPDDQLLIAYTRDGVNEFVLDHSGGGIGDVRLDASYRLAGSVDAKYGAVLRAGVKLPTGDAGNLRGSGATDFSVDVAMRRELPLPRGRLVLVAHAGVLVLGDGELLPQLQRDTVRYAGAGAVWRLNERWRLNLQLYGQTSYFRSELKALGSDSLALAVGGSYTWAGSRMRLSVGVIEDPVPDITPDVALQVELRKDFQ